MTGATWSWRRLLAAGALTAAAAPAAAQTRWERQVQQQLRVVAADVAPQGWRYASDPLTGRLGQGERETLYVALREGGQYAIVALCDEDCRDLAVTVMGGDDAVLAQSQGWSDTPLLEVRPQATAKYRVVVTMSHCGTGPCAYGIGVFHK